METVRTIRDLRARIFQWRAAGSIIGLAPTMGALHAGHIELVRRAVKEADKVVVTLFVNPAQFGEGEDFSVYPRDEARDGAMVEAEGAALLFAPDVSEIYPEGYATRVNVGPIGEMLEGAFRPGFFEGVATVCAKLLVQSLPDKAYFGIKDYQQVQVIKRLVRDLDIPSEIVPVETVRDPDGLALSSRNGYLTADERAVAGQLNAALRVLAEAARSGADVTRSEAEQGERLLAAGFSNVDYLTVRDAETLAENPSAGRLRRVLGAARLGRARLIDNIPV